MPCQANKITKSLWSHWSESRKYFSNNQMFVLALQGSQNYELDTEDSDIDTKLLLIPSFRSLAMNLKPISTTHVLENNEHTDWKDIRLYFQTFRKQNLNFLEILFTKYYLVNENYEKEWEDLRSAGEEIARMNPHRGVMSMYGLGETKFKNLKHSSPAADPFIEKYGYVPKELHHLLRIEDFIERYIDGEKFAECLRPRDPETLISIKKGALDLASAESEAQRAIKHVRAMKEDFCNKVPSIENQEIVEFLDEVQYNIMKKAMINEVDNWRRCSYE